MTKVFKILFATGFLLLTSTWSNISSAAIVQIDPSTSGIQTSGGLAGTGYGFLTLSGSFNLIQEPSALPGWYNLTFEDIDIVVGAPGFQSPTITSALPNYSAAYDGNLFAGGVICIYVEGIICPTDNTTGSYNGTSFSMSRDYFSGSPDDFNYTIIINGTISAVPVPAAIWLFGSGLIGLGIAKRKHKRRLHTSRQFITTFHSPSFSAFVMAAWAGLVEGRR